MKGVLAVNRMDDRTYRGNEQTSCLKYVGQAERHLVWTGSDAELARCGRALVLRDPYQHRVAADTPAHVSHNE